MALHAVVDESGQRSRSRRSSDHFVMAGVVYRDTNQPHVDALLEAIRADLGRRSGDRLSWKNIKSHQQRTRAAQLLGEATFLKISGVVVCKRLLPPSLPDEDSAYLYTLRYLLERLSWIAGQDEGEPGATTLAYTLSHVRRFPMYKLREYERRLRELGEGDAGTQIRWNHLDPKGGRLESDRKVTSLQLSDLAASAIADAFEPDRFGNTEQRYIRELAPRFYRGYRDQRALTSYGLKMHPWNDAARTLYPWVDQL